MKIVEIKIIIAVLFFTASNHAEGAFWYKERFFETDKNDPQILAVKPKLCPDGSYFLVLDVTRNKGKQLIETATCVYGNSEVIVEHQWIDGVKYRETTSAHNKTIGIEKLWLGKKLYAVNENCNRKMVRVEILDALFKLDTILLFTSNTKPVESINAKKASADVIIKVKEKTIIGKENLSNFSACDLSILPDKLKPPLYWNWFNLEKAREFKE